MTVIDYLISHQAALLAAVAPILVVLVVTAMKWHGSITTHAEQTIRRRLDLRGTIGSRKERYVSGTGWLLLERLVRPIRKMPILFVAVVMVVVAAAVLSVVTDWTPIPKTVGLKLPDIETAEAGKRATKLLIFIHGWNGDKQDTWEKFPQLARNDPPLGEYDIWPIDYPTYMFRRQLGIEGLARFFDDQFQTVYGIDARYESIVIICHSMGGLVARRLLIRRTLRGENNSRYAALIEIATPHQGADPAALADALDVSRGVTEEMKAGSSFLNVLQDDWRQLQRRRPHTFCLGSNHDRVVSSESALADCDEGVLYPMGYSHTALVKPDNAQDQRYTTPVAHIPGVPPLSLSTPGVVK